METTVYYYISDGNYCILLYFRWKLLYNIIFQMETTVQYYISDGNYSIIFSSILALTLVADYMKIIICRLWIVFGKSEQLYHNVVWMLFLLISFNLWNINHILFPAWLFPQAYKVYDEGVRKGHFRSRYQRSLYNVDSLRAKPQWTLKEAGFVEAARVRQKTTTTCKWHNRPLANRIGLAGFFFFIFCMKYITCSYSLSQRNHKFTDLTIMMIVIAILCDKSLFLALVYEEEHLHVLSSFSYLSCTYLCLIFHFCLNEAMKKKKFLDLKLEKLFCLFHYFYNSTIMLKRMCKLWGHGVGGGGGGTLTHFFSDWKILWQNYYQNGVGVLSSSPYVTELTSKKKKKSQNHRGGNCPPPPPWCRAWWLLYFCDLYVLK